MLVKPMEMSATRNFQGAKGNQNGERHAKGSIEHQHMTNSTWVRKDKITTKPPHEGRKQSTAHTIQIVGCAHRPECLCRGPIIPVGVKKFPSVQESSKKTNLKHDRVVKFERSGIRDRVWGRLAPPFSQFGQNCDN